jgi:DNA uptake protein ComE-like DNA-binding protein
METDMGVRMIAIVILAALAGGVSVGQETRKAPVAKVDLNTADALQIQTLPGITSEQAKKIIGARPFRSVEDLKAVGLTDAQIEELAPRLVWTRRPRGERSIDRAREVEVDAPTKEPPKVKLDLNSASAPELEALPGVGPTIAKKIIAARPFRRLDELKALGLTDAQLAALTPFAGVKQPMAPPPRDQVKDPPLGGKDPPIGGKDPPAVPEIDLNAGTVTELKTIPGVTDDVAKKIVANRPYADPADVARAGIAADMIPRVTAMATVEAPARTPPSPGLVWVNTDSRIFHPPGARWYGKTARGRWMTEAEAVQAGYRSLK